MAEKEIQEVEDFKTGEESSFKVERPQINLLKVGIIGTTPYVGTRFAQEVQDDITQGHIEGGKGIAKKKKGERDLDKEVNNRRHIIDNVDCIPVLAFKASLIDASKEFKLGESTRRAIMIFGDKQDYASIRDKNDNFMKPESFSAVVKLANGQNFTAYRPAYKDWTTTLLIQYLSSVYNDEDIVNLLLRAGLTTGVGDTRRIGGGRYTINENKVQMINRKKV